LTAPKRFHGFAQQVVQWQRLHGRNDLPWQNTQDPYRVWLSEIMLQQTQVATVRAYFARFVEAYPDVASLASAPLDAVLGLWSGLGYYTRARNLHRCAQQVMEQHGGAFPRQAQVLETLPGIGRSTAAAIASLCFGERVAILDANVKRVVARVTALEADLSAAAAVRELWALAEQLLPQGATAQTDMPRYTQGMMDLGATICLPKKPLCAQCPVRSHCAAQAAGDPQRYPVRTRRIKRSSQSLWMLWAHTQQGAVWLDQRPTPGVWAGLHCFPLFDSEEALHHAVPAAWRKHLHPLPMFTHVLTHKDLHLHVWQLTLPASTTVWQTGAWVDAEKWRTLGLPAPVRKLLERGVTAD
jgi:A/G-specific adenine glycosylase